MSAGFSTSGKHQGRGHPSRGGTGHWVRRAAKVDLHVHLEGSLTPSVVAHLAQVNGLARPLVFARHGNFGDFDSFLAAIGSVRSVLRTSSDFEYAAYDVGARASRDGVRYMELHVTPDLHRRERGVRIPEMSLALDRAAQRLHRERGFVMRFIYDHVRSAGVEACERTVEDALDARALGVAALGLSGHEHGGNAPDVASAIRRAQDNGLAFVAHAGELRGPSSIREVVELGARRIGHGIQCLQDPALVSMLVERKIPLEVCLSSNRAVGCTPNLAAHPLRRLLGSGLVVVLGTDDPSLFETSLSAEYELAAKDLRLPDLSLRRMMTNAIEHSLASGAEKATLRTEFEASLRPVVVEG